MSSSDGAYALTTREKLILAVVHAVRGAHSPTSELREAVSAYTHELKAGARTPEQALVELKALLAEAGLRLSGPRLTWSRAEHPEAAYPEAEIVDWVVFWCIEAYFPGGPESNR
jgi:hypothetical protein